MTEQPMPSTRLAVLDAARGFAVILMAVYHATWDAVYFRLTDIALFTDPFWIAFPRFIAGLFLGIAGFSLVLWWRAGADRPRFARRLAMVGASAAAITGATWLAFPQQYVFFGILHCLTLGSLLALPFFRLPLLAVLGAAVLFVAGPSFLSAPPFDAPWLRWLGLVTLRPSTVDYVPVFPWFGVLLGGLFLGRLVLDRGWMPEVGAPRFLRWMGRHSLAIYLLHQPILFGLAWGAAFLAR